ncbi:helix-turn-helix domain-containing protein [Xenorhabdus bovienii]|uniref:STY4528 family pathogenicity island replication protein n=1 Tax=Xenorhabdus bovienii TaxID=40576 RepID=UPI0023B240B4|nr:STY4528 family pathogenicity island replication protein [Xenorhabdus bovienii]MDE9493754.1 helix-turn-helix domain-containing protein [Xenorhabdus bovienii]MDE9502291.1 helix-turn-helix domain-containing protein [Xenorhabdus bovienii]MDE9526100.1 helix-turn-helix domain-containing protein [Xenorhabdus bovienii]MDE9569540.1 helix-turn-helix domain-containing protein [Xenorhabdus bovienii]
MINLSADSLIAHTMAKMKKRLEQRSDDDVSQLRSGLLFMGNLQDAYPRGLLLDDRLSPLDKTGWMMIRLYAQQNEGAVFPSYDELQVLLASPYKGKASRETVSRVLLMLRITGWLSLCKRIRDEQGRVRGNIYAQHDEPLTGRDAEILDPHWLDTVAEACRSKNRTISQTAWSVLTDIKEDQMMRHRHSHICLLEARLNAVQTPQQRVMRQALQQAKQHTELSEMAPDSETELRPKEASNKRNSVSELSVKSLDCSSFTKPNRYVRSFTQSVNKKTYVDPQPVIFLPEGLCRQLEPEDVTMLTSQLQSLPAEQAQIVLDCLDRALRAGKIGNPVGWLLTMMKRAREGKLYAQAESTIATPGSAKTQVAFIRETECPVSPSSQAHVRNVVKDIRQRLTLAKYQQNPD